MPRESTRLSTRTKKQIDELPPHAKHIFKKAHNNAIKHYKSPAKRTRGGSRTEVAHRVAWAAVKKKYRKQGGEWKPK